MKMVQQQQLETVAGPSHVLLLTQARGARARSLEVTRRGEKIPTLGPEAKPPPKIAISRRRLTSPSPGCPSPCTLGYIASATRVGVSLLNPVPSPSSPLRLLPQQ